MSWNSDRRPRLGHLNPIEGAFEQTMPGGDISDKGQLLQRMFENVRRGQELNVFRGTQRYKAIVLTSPKLIQKKEAASEAEDDLNTNHYVFRARIPEIHTSIPDPTCFDADDRKSKRFVLMHPKFISVQSSEHGDEAGVEILDIVWVDFSKGAAGSRGIAGHYLGPSQEAKYHEFGECKERGTMDGRPGGAGACGGNPGECDGGGSGGSAGSYEAGTEGGIPSATPGGSQYDPRADADAQSGPCGELWYEDTYGLGVGNSQVSQCCCGQVRYQGTDNGNHMCSDVRGCHMVTYKSLDRRVNGMRPGSPHGKLNCSTGPYHKYPADPSSLDERFQPLWAAFVAEVIRQTGVRKFSYTSVRRSAKHQWVLYVGDQGMKRSGIYIPSAPCNGSGGRLFGHALGMACDGKWRYKAGSLNPGWSSDYNTLAQEIEDTIAVNFGIKWQGTGDVPHWECRYVWLDADGVTGVLPGQGTKTSVSSLRSTSLYSEICTNYYYGLFGNNACQWHEEFYDLPLDELGAACPNAEIDCLANYCISVGGDPSTFHPSVVYTAAPVPMSPNTSAWDTQGPVAADAGNTSDLGPNPSGPNESSDGDYYAAE